VSLVSSRREEKHTVALDPDDEISEGDCESGDEEGESEGLEQCHP